MALSQRELGIIGSSRLSTHAGIQRQPHGRSDAPTLPGTDGTARRIYAEGGKAIWPNTTEGNATRQAMRLTQSACKFPAGKSHCRLWLLCVEPHPYRRCSLECRETDIGRTLCIEVAFYGLAGPRC